MLPYLLVIFLFCVHSRNTDGEVSNYFASLDPLSESSHLQNIGKHSRLGDSVYSGGNISFISHLVNPMITNGSAFRRVSHIDKLNGGSYFQNPGSVNDKPSPSKDDIFSSIKSKLFLHENQINNQYNVWTNNAHTNNSTPELYFPNKVLENNPAETFNMIAYENRNINVGKPMIQFRGKILDPIASFMYSSSKNKMNNINADQATYDDTNQKLKKNYLSSIHAHNLKYTSKYKTDESINQFLNDYGVKNLNEFLHHVEPWDLNITSGPITLKPIGLINNIKEETLMGNNNETQDR